MLFKILDPPRIFVQNLRPHPRIFVQNIGPKEITRSLGEVFEPFYIYKQMYWLWIAKKMVCKATKCMRLGGPDPILLW